MCLRAELLDGDFILSLSIFFFFLEQTMCMTCWYDCEMQVKLHKFIESVLLILILATCFKIIFFLYSWCSVCDFVTLSILPVWTLLCVQLVVWQRLINRLVDFISQWTHARNSENILPHYLCDCSYKTYKKKIAQQENKNCNCLPMRF